MTGLLSMSVIFLGTKRSLKRWRMREFLMSSYFAEMLTLIGSSSIGKATTTSSMVSRRVDKDTGEEVAAGATRRME